MTDAENKGKLVEWKRDEQGKAKPKPKAKPIVYASTRVRRNEKCGCGSGKKVKACCMRSMGFILHKPADPAS